MRIKCRGCETGELTVIETDGSKISSVRAASEADSEREDSFDLSLDDVWASPGFIDLQINGYGGFDFNRDYWSDDEPNESLSERFFDLITRSGVTQFCPTICTNGYEAMREGMRRVARFCENSCEWAAAIPGIHMEGPYISPEDGPRGAHPLDHVRKPDWEEFKRLQDASEGRIKLVTLAPETEGALSFIEKAAESGVTVAIGHSAASSDDIRNATNAGARLSTHLGNGAHSMIPRHPNYIWEQLANDDLCASIIADGHHLPSSVVKCFARIKGVERLCLVSDSVSLGGLAPGIYGDGRFELLPSGKIVLYGTPYLAGAGHALDTCVANVLRFTDLEFSDLPAIASANPARLLNLEQSKGRIAPGYDADLTLFRYREEGPLEIVAAIRSGVIAYSEH